MANYKMGLPTSVGDLRERQKVAIGRRERLAKIVADDKILLDKKREEIARQRKTLPPEVVKQMERHWDKEFIEYKKEVLGKSEQARLDLRRALKADADDVKDALGFLGSAPQLLSAAGLDTPENTTRRHQLTEMLRTAGDAALRTHAQRAVATNDRVLGAVIASIVDAKSRDSRPLDAGELAQALCGEDSKMARLAAEEIRMCYERGHNDNQELESGRVSTVAKISEGLAARQQQRLMADINPDVLDNGDDGNSKSEK
jgi:hypothetical protein